MCLQHLAFIYIWEKMIKCYCKVWFQEPGCHHNQLGRASSTVHIQMIPRDGCRFFERMKFLSKDEIFREKGCLSEKKRTIDEQKGIIQRSEKISFFLKGMKKGNHLNKL